MNMTNHSSQSVTTEFGKLHIVASDSHLIALAFNQNWAAVKERLERHAKESGQFRLRGEPNAIIRRALKELHEFADGRRTSFSVPLKIFGTDFEKRTWSELRKVSQGKTLTYAELATKIGQPTAVRAVASANARNPISILIPCHRVISTSGALTGYSGGLALKKKLLTLEAAPRGG